MNIGDIKKLGDDICENVSKVMVGEEEKIKLILTCFLAGGNVLIEDKPGTGKTVLSKTFARTIGGDFKRVQFTPDLMPLDVIGMNIYNRKKEEFELVKGPVFTDVLLADEINRATPRTQSALLEAMEEKQVTIDGKTLSLSDNFMVIATENPVETVGTYPLPAAQLDRFFMKLGMTGYDKQKELDILDRFINDNPMENLASVCSMQDIENSSKEIKNVYVHECVRNYLVDIIMETRRDSKISSGASTRGMLSLLRCAQAYSALSGKDYVDPDTVRYLAPFVLNHRINANYTVGTYDQCMDKVRKMAANVSVPVEDWRSR